MPNNDVRLKSKVLPPLRPVLTLIIQNIRPFKDLPHIHHPVIYYLMPETAAWESTYFLRELWLKWSWPQCKHMSERWLTISHYNSLSTHPGSSNSCPHYSQKVSEIRLSEYSTQSPNKTHRPWASRSGAGEGGGLRFPAQERGPESGEDTESASLQLPWQNVTRGGFVWRNAREHSAPRQHWHITLI